MLVLHGGGGIAEVDKAMAWAQRGYVAVSPDLPGIADPKKLTDTKGRWNALKYGEGRWVATPDASASVIFDAVLAAMKALYLLRSQPACGYIAHRRGRLFLGRVHDYDGLRTGGR